MARKLLLVVAAIVLLTFPLITAGDETVAVINTTTAGVVNQTCVWEEVSHVKGKRVLTKKARFQGSICSLVSLLKEHQPVRWMDHRIDLVSVCEGLEGNVDEVKNGCESPDHIDGRDRHWQTVEGLACFKKGEKVFISANEGARPLRLLGAKPTGNFCPRNGHR